MTTTTATVTRKSYAATVAESGVVSHAEGYNFNTSGPVCGRNLSSRRIVAVFTSREEVAAAVTCVRCRKALNR